MPATCSASQSYSAKLKWGNGCGLFHPLVRNHPTSYEQVAYNLVFDYIWDAFVINCCWIISLLLLLLNVVIIVECSEKEHCCWLRGGVFELECGHWWRMACPPSDQSTLMSSCSTFPFIFRAVSWAHSWDRLHFRQHKCSHSLQNPLILPHFHF